MAGGTNLNYALPVMPQSDLVIKQDYPFSA
jgi:hypothetical protein